MKQPGLHMPGWPEMAYHGIAKADGSIWWWEESMPDGSIKRHALQPRRCGALTKEERQ